MNEAGDWTEKNVNCFLFVDAIFPRSKIAVRLISFNQEPAFSVSFYQTITPYFGTGRFLDAWNVSPPFLIGLVTIISLWAPLYL